MSLNETVVATLRSMMDALGSQAITVDGTDDPVDALVSDKGVCVLPADVANHPGERARYAVAKVVRADLTELPESGSDVTMLGSTWQVRRAAPMGLAGDDGGLSLHCVTETYSRGR